MEPYVIRSQAHDAQKRTSIASYPKAVSVDQNKIGPAVLPRGADLGAAEATAGRPDGACNHWRRAFTNRQSTPR
jgi:hypothetical protein